jgi:hypothetical protein
MMSAHLIAFIFELCRKEFALRRINQFACKVCSIDEYLPVDHLAVVLARCDLYDRLPLLERNPAPIPRADILRLGSDDATLLSLLENMSGPTRDPADGKRGSE